MQEIITNIETSEHHPENLDDYIDKIADWIFQHEGCILSADNDNIVKAMGNLIDLKSKINTGYKDDASIRMSFKKLISDAEKVINKYEVNFKWD